MDEAMRFCHQRNYAKVYLWTFGGLFASRHVYEKFGFRLVDQKEGAQWGRNVIEQK
jgi:RimJ/RimL family protein N-acetyltransferase